MNTKREYIIVGLGELLWDIFLQGKCLGGAPANFAYHISALGHKGIIASRIGKDTLGKEIINVIATLGLTREYIQIDPNHPTGTVDVRVDSNGHPKYTITENVAWDFFEFDEKWKILAKKADAVCFGSLAQRSSESRTTIIEFLKHTGKEIVRIFDINLRQNFYSPEIIIQSLKISSILKLNDEELPILIDLLGYQKKESEEELCRLLIEKYGLDLVCLTKGRNGSLLVNERETVKHPGRKVTVIDTVGAGDAFTAALAIQYLKGSSLERISEAANKLGSWVASQAGATPPANKYVQ
ncbi:carbohydrate kinase [Candidatus Aerophobetes bacterium Ae_b3a]|nr:MAG: carbohydrate kinase [Candidatus Aerophobetes bacterium Ae_b3a]